MNGAIKYFREHGLEKSKKHLLDIREAVNQVSWVHSLEGFSQDLKRLIESWELVEKLGGINKAKDYVLDGYKSVQLKQAIADVESCLEVEKKLEGL